MVWFLEVTESFGRRGSLGMSAASPARHMAASVNSAGVKTVCALVAKRVILRTGCSQSNSAAGSWLKSCGERAMKGKDVTYHGLRMQAPELLALSRADVYKIAHCATQTSQSAVYLAASKCGRDEFSGRKQLLT